MTRVMTSPISGSAICAAEAIACAEANLCRDLIPDESDHAGQGQKPKVCQRPWMNEPLNRLTKSDEGTDEDREHDS